jgi:hypothetical protein
MNFKNLNNEVYSQSYLTKYQPNDIIRKLIHQKTNNYHVIKDRTGSGATFGILKLKGEKILLLSPTVQLVKDKEEEYIKGMFDGEIKFLYGNSEDKKEDINPLKSQIIMGTVDKLVYLPYSVLASNGYTLIIDELHLDVMSSTYRPVLSEQFINLINMFKKYNNVITLTATPLYKYPKEFKKFKTINLYSKRENNDVHIINDKEIHNSIVKDIIKQKGNLLYFCNSGKELNKIATEFIRGGYRKEQIALIVGSAVFIKHITTFGRRDNDDIKLILATTAAMEGVNIKLDNADVIINNKIYTEYGSYSVQNMVQALGRIREGYERAYVLLDKNDRSEENIVEDKPPPSSMTKTAEENRILNLEIIKDFDKLHNKMLELGYDIISAKKIKRVSELNGTSLSIKLIVRNILELNDNEYKYMYGQVIHNLYISRSFMGYSTKIGFAFMISEIIKNHNLDKTESLVSLHQDGKIDTQKAISSFRSYFNSKRSDKSLLRNDEKFEVFYSLTYPHHKKLKKIDEYIENEYITETTIPVFSFLAYLKNQSKKSKAALRKIKKPTTEQEYGPKRWMMVYDMVKSTIKTKELDYRKFVHEYIKLFNDTDIFSFNSKKRFKEITDFVKKHVKKTMLKQLKELGAIYVREFKSGVKKRGFREFSALTSLPIDIIGIAFPFRTLELDITGAYPSFVKALTSSKVEDVYKNIQERMLVSRKEAKIQYNMFLNSTNDDINFEKRFDFFHNKCGYEFNVVPKILDINSKKGEAYEKLSKIEKEVINKLEDILNIVFKDNIRARRHDSLIIFNTDKEIEPIIIQTTLEHLIDDVDEDDFKMPVVETKIHVSVI